MKKTEGSTVDKKKITPKAPQVNCESCVHFMYDDDYDMEMCELDLDEDEMERYAQGRYKECPYYRFYDEYKSVQRQN